jgi:hypothetical protein
VYLKLKSNLKMAFPSVISASKRITAETKKPAALNSTEGGTYILIRHRASALLWKGKQRAAQLAKLEKKYYRRKGPSPHLYDLHLMLNGSWELVNQKK